MKIPIEVSARHVHLSQDHVNILFGAGYECKIYINLSQTGQYACEEKVDLIGPKDKIEGVRVLGPCRKRTQVEVSETDAHRLGIDPPVRESGDIDGSASVKIVGPKGEVTLVEGVIIALRHIHSDPETAGRLGIKNGDRVKVDVDGIRDLIFENVAVRVDPSFRLAMHIDTDEGNAAQIDKKNHTGELIR